MISGSVFPHVVAIRASVDAKVDSDAIEILLAMTMILTLNRDAIVGPPLVPPALLSPCLLFLPHSPLPLSPSPAPPPPSSISPSLPPPFCGSGFYQSMSEVEREAKLHLVKYEQVGLVWRVWVPVKT